MKFPIKPRALPWVTLGAGMTGLLLHKWLYATGMESNGLLSASHPSQLLLPILTFLLLALLVVAVHPLRPVHRYSRLFPASAVGACGCLAAAGGILLAVLKERARVQDIFSLVTLVVGCLAVLAMLGLGYLRLRGRQPHYVLHLSLTVYFMLHMVCQYRIWSSQPQLYSYVYPLLSSILLMFVSYCRSCADTGEGNRRIMVFVTLFALYCCCISISSTGGLYYLAMALWLLTGICSLHVSRRRPAAPPSEEVNPTDAPA